MFFEIPFCNFQFQRHVLLFFRFYSNNDEDKSIPYFWEKFDAENYSIWRCDYKYNDELTMVFMSCNLIGGMFQRLDKLRTTVGRVVFNEHLPHGLPFVNGVLKKKAAQVSLVWRQPWCSSNWPLGTCLIRP